MNGPTIQSGDFYVGFQLPSPYNGMLVSSDSDSAAWQRSFYSLDNAATWGGPYALEDGTPVNFMIRGMAARGQATGMWLPVGQATIPPDGGKADRSGLSVSVPAGAINSALQLTVSKPVASQPAAGGRVSEYYRVEGLPDANSAPIALTLDSRNAPTDGTEVLMPAMGEGDDGSGPMVLKGAVSGGRVTAQLAAAPGWASGTSATSDRNAPAPRSLADNGKLTWILWLIGAGTMPNASPGGHFIVHCSPRISSDCTFVAALEDACKWIGTAGLGLDWGPRGLPNSPIQAYVFTFNSRVGWAQGFNATDAGMAESDIWGTDNIGLSINQDAPADREGTTSAKFEVGPNSKGDVNAAVDVAYEIPPHTVHYVSKATQQPLSITIKFH